jgi:hypothetical protein
MRRSSRQVLIGALVVLLLSSACGRLSISSPTPVWTVTPVGQPASPTATLLSPTGTSVTPQIPITGENVVYLQCEFCVDAVTHAVLILPDAASFDVSSDTPVSCVTADIADGRRILLCHGTASTTFTLNVCSDASNCQQFQGVLQACPLMQVGVTATVTGIPFNLTPVATLKTPAKKTRQPADTAVPSRTPTSGGVYATPPAGTAVPPTIVVTSTTRPPTTATSASYTLYSQAEMGR